MNSAAEQPPSPDTIDALADAILPSMALLAAMRLDLFTALKDRPSPCESIAAALRVAPDKLSPLLFALVNAGLLDVEGERFANRPESDHYLVRGRPEFMGDRHLLWSNIWQALLSTSDSIRSGQPQAKHDFSTMSAENLDAFFHGLHPKALAEGRAFAHSHDLSSFSSLLDIGGGSGGFSIGLTEQCQHIQATVAELPAVAAITRNFVKTAGVDRVQVIPVDLVREPIRQQFQIAVLKNLIQVLGRSEAQQLIRHAFDALEPGGLIFVLGHIIENNRLAPAESVYFNLVFLNVYEEGQAYTKREYAGWLTAAGFADIEFACEGQIAARKPTS